MEDAHILGKKITLDNEDKMDDEDKKEEDEKDQYLSAVGNIGQWQLRNIHIFFYKK